MGEEYSRQGTSITLGARMQREEWELVSLSSRSVGQQDSKWAAGVYRPQTRLSHERLRVPANLVWSGSEDELFGQSSI